MKRRDLIKQLETIAKAENLRLHFEEGGNHTKVRIGDRYDVVPRHNEINELTAKSILKKMKGDTK